MWFFSFPLNLYLNSSFLIFVTDQVRIMNYLIYLLFVKPISILPYRILYVFSDGLYWLVYRVLGYRRKVVAKNIQNSFPEKTAGEQLAIERAFYSHFFDLILEVIKQFSITKETVLDRCKVLNPELVDAYAKQGRSVFMLAGHYGNWELFVLTVQMQIQHQTVGIYHPLKNKFWDKKIAEVRSQFGMELISKRDLSGFFERTLKETLATFFGTDQAPSDPYRAYWMTFLNQDTPVFFGAEKYAKDYDQVVVYCDTKKVKRGYYEIEFKLVSDTPREEPYGAITEKHVKILEAQIMREPAYWLWTHKRWKRKKPANYEEYLAKYKAKAAQQTYS